MAPRGWHPREEVVAPNGAVGQQPRKAGPMKTKQRTLGVGGGVLVLLAVYAVDPALCTAATRYVDPAGSDVANDCSTPAAPCATIGQAIAVASGGDTLQVAAGTYS